MATLIGGGLIWWIKSRLAQAEDDRLGRLRAEDAIHGDLKADEAEDEARINADEAQSNAQEKPNLGKW